MIEFKFRWALSVSCMKFVHVDGLHGQEDSEVPSSAKPKAVAIKRKPSEIRNGSPPNAPRGHLPTTLPVHHRTTATHQHLTKTAHFM